jgi:hypothetical protein
MVLTDSFQTASEGPGKTYDPLFLHSKDHVEGRQRANCGIGVDTSFRIQIDERPILQPFNTKLTCTWSINRC